MGDSTEDVNLYLNNDITNSNGPAIYLQMQEKQVSD